jgi:hypothetical protein
MYVVVIATTNKRLVVESTTSQRVFIKEVAMVQRIYILITELPGLMRLGVLILAIGAVLDLLYHTAPPGWAMQLDGYLGSDGVGAHLVTLLGMVVTLLGLFARRASAPVAHVEVIPSEGRATIEQ